MHHKLCHVIGGMLDLPHAEMHAALLPYTAAFLLPAAPAAERRIAAALDADDAAAGIAELTREVGTPQSLGELGMSEDDVERVAAAAEPDLPESATAAHARRARGSLAARGARHAPLTLV